MMKEHVSRVQNNFTHVCVSVKGLMLCLPLKMPYCAVIRTERSFNEDSGHAVILEF